MGRRLDDVLPPIQMSNDAYYKQAAPLRIWVHNPWPNARKGRLYKVPRHQTLSWKTHVDVISKHANNMCFFLSRNLHKCSKDTEEAACWSLVRLLVEYASLVWDPHTKADTDKLERVQRMTAWFVCGDYKHTSSVSAKLNQLGWESLQQWRKQAVMMYRIVYRLVAIPTGVLIPTMSIRGHLFLVPYARTVTDQKSFFPVTIRSRHKHQKLHFTRLIQVRSAENGPTLNPSSRF